MLRAETGGVTHQLLAGVEVARLTDRFTLDVGFLPNIGLERPIETAQGPVFLIPGQSQGAHASSLVVAPYVADQIALSDKLQVLSGARFDSIDYEDDVTRPARNSEGRRRSAWSDAVRRCRLANAAGLRRRASRWWGARARGSEQIEAGIKTELWRQVAVNIRLYELQRDNVAMPTDGLTRQTLASAHGRRVDWRPSRCRACARSSPTPTPTRS